MTKLSEFNFTLDVLRFTLLINNWLLEIEKSIGDFTQKVSVKVRLAQIRRAKLKKFEELGEAIFNLTLGDVADASKDPTVKRLVEELREQDREINQLLQLYLRSS